MTFEQSIYIEENYIFNKQKSLENKNNKIIQDEVKKVIEKVKLNNDILKGYTLKNNVLRLNIGNIVNVSTYSQLNEKAKSQIIQQIRKSLQSRSISMKRVNDYFVVDFYNKNKVKANEVFFEGR